MFEDSDKTSDLRLDIRWGGGKVMLEAEDDGNGRDF